MRDYLGPDAITTILLIHGKWGTWYRDTMGEAGGGRKERKQPQPKSTASHRDLRKGKKHTLDPGKLQKESAPAGLHTRPYPVSLDLDPLPPELQGTNMHCIRTLN